MDMDASFRCYVCEFCSNELPYILRHSQQLHVTCRGFGWTQQNTITFNKGFIQAPRAVESTYGDAALIPAIHRITSPYNHTKWFTCGEHLLRCGINTSNIYTCNHMLITTLQYKQSLPNNRASAQPRNTWRASGAPRIASSGFGKPPTRLGIVFPAP